MKFDEHCDRLWFAFDFNGDGVITITDVGEWSRYVLFTPAKIVMAFLDSFPALRSFFETDCNTGLSFGGVIFSGFVWLIVWVMIAGSISAKK